MEKDRRKPLGGVTKEAYIHNGGHELTYDLLQGLKSDICHKIDGVDDRFIKAHAAYVNHQRVCEKKYVTRKQFYVGIAICGAFVTGLGILNWKDLAEVIGKII